MKLTKNNIKFINNYLKNSGVEYIDVRHEMTDHVASALEEMDGDFYEVFKEYMQGNKLGLLQMNTGFKKSARKKAWGILRANFLKPVFAINAVLLFLAGSIALNYFDAEYVIEIFRGVFVITLFILMGYYGYCKWMVRNSYSVVDKLIAVSYISSLCFNFQSFIHNPVYLLLYLSAAISFMGLLFYTFHQLVQKSKLRYG